LQIPNNSQVANLTDWVEDVAECLALNYYLSRDFDITVIESLIKLTAKEYGDQYIFNFATEVSQRQPFLTNLLLS